MLFVAALYTWFIKSLCPVWQSGDKSSSRAGFIFIPIILVIRAVPNCPPDVA